MIHVANYLPQENWNPPANEELWLQSGTVRPAWRSEGHSDHYNVDATQSLWEKGAVMFFRRILRGFSTRNRQMELSRVCPPFHSAGRAWNEPVPRPHYVVVVRIRVDYRPVPVMESFVCHGAIPSGPVVCEFLARTVKNWSWQSASKSCKSRSTCRGQRRRVCAW